MLKRNRLMKTLFLMLCFAITIIAKAQDPTWINNSEIKEVKLYQNGAMVNRTAKVNLNPGIQEVVFDALSPYINPQSISLKGSGDLVILSVSFQQNYLKDSKKSKEVINLEELLDSLNLRNQQLQNKINTLNEMQAILAANRAIGGANNGVVADELEMVVDYYNKKSSAIKEDLLDFAVKQKKLSTQIVKAQQQLAQLNSKENRPVGNIVVNVNNKAKAQLSFDLSYAITSYATWYSFYDIRAKDINSPVELVYKAKVNQNTGEDWTRVKLKLSTGNPAEGNVRPELYPWYLNFIMPQTMYRQQGKAEANSPAAYDRDDKQLKEVVIAQSNFAAPAVQINQNQLASEFEILDPYSIPSDGKDYQVEIQHYDVKANYNYVAVPKVDADAFLTAQLTGWENLSLTPGSANIYFDGAFVGESYINPAETNDTLEVSLGRDKRIVIKREKLKDVSGNKFFGGNRERTFSYEITVKNNKKEAVNIILEDQVPVSNDKDIEVKMIDNSAADYKTDTGEIKWKLTVLPAETRKLKLTFSVKYPKDKVVSGL